MAETIAVLTIFFFLLVFGFGFYMRFHQNYISNQQYKIANLKALQISQKAAYMPEFQCSIQNVQEDNCFDSLKADIFEKMINGSDELKERYYEVLGFSRIELKEIYPSQDGWVLYDFLLNESDSINSMIPVSIYYPATRRYTIGILNITVSRET